MATTFHLFSFLPWELRARIWELTVEPRTVEVHTIRWLGEPDPEVYAGGWRPYQRLVSTTPVPAPLHTCREARSLGLYQKAFSEVEDVPENGEKRYIWLNLDIDMIDFGREDLGKYYMVAKSVRRLRFRAHKFDDDDVFSFSAFVNLTEAQIYFHEDGLGSWHRNWVVFKLSFDLRNILLIDTQNDRTITAQEVYDDYLRQEQLEEELAEEELAAEEYAAEQDMLFALQILEEFGILMY